MFVVCCCAVGVISEVEPKFLRLDWISMNPNLTFVFHDDKAGVDYLEKYGDAVAISQGKDMHAKCLDESPLDVGSTRVARGVVSPDQTGEGKVPLASGHTTATVTALARRGPRHSHQGGLDRELSVTKTRRK